MPQTDILILTTRTGGGHWNLAQSLREMLEARFTVTIIDPYPDLMQRYYTTLSRHYLSLWDFQYTWADSPGRARFVHHVLTYFIRDHIATLIGQLKPMMILSTHPLLSYEVARANGRLARRTPLVFQLTDLAQVHRSWFTEKRADAYLVPTREILAQALANNVVVSRLHMTGRPVRSQFSQVKPVARDAVVTELGLNPTLFTVFLQGGAKGSASVERTAMNVLAADVPIQIILAAGNNTALIPYFAGHERVKVLPFTEQIAPYMAAADLIVGKAGASFLSEAFMLEKPCLITSYLPGQETPNLRILKQHNLGWVALEPDIQRQLIRAIAANPALLYEKRESTRIYRAWNVQANQAIMPVVCSFLHSSVEA